jgi:dUTP pyrophosphatase
VETVNVEIKRLWDVPLPQYAHGPEEDAGFDLRAREPVRLRKDVPTLVKTGLAIALPPGYEAQIRSRSGLALKEGLYVLNAPATIDPGYRGEIGVILVWNGFCKFGAAMWYDVQAGERIAQCVIAKYAGVNFVETEELGESNRGEGGFGSTGK